MKIIIFGHWDAPGPPKRRPRIAHKIRLVFLLIFGPKIDAKMVPKMQKINQKTHFCRFPWSTRPPGWQVAPHQCQNGSKRRPEAPKWWQNGTPRHQKETHMAPKGFKIATQGTSKTTTKPKDEKLKSRWLFGFAALGPATLRHIDEKTKGRRGPRSVYNNFDTESRPRRRSGVKRSTFDLEQPSAHFPWLRRRSVPGGCQNWRRNRIRKSTRFCVLVCFIKKTQTDPEENICLRKATKNN